METSKRARRRKPDTAKTDLKPPLEVLRRTGCPPRGGIRRVCGEVPGRSRWGLPQGRTGRPKVGQGRACTMEAKAFLIHPPHQGVCGRHGMEDLSVTPGGLSGSSGGTEGSDPISASEVGSGVLGVVGRLGSTSSAVKAARPCMWQQSVLGKPAGEGGRGEPEDEMSKAGEEDSSFSERPEPHRPRRLVDWTESTGGEEGSLAHGRDIHRWLYVRGCQPRTRQTSLHDPFSRRSNKTLS